MLGPDVAAGFLISRTGDPDWQAARDLAGMLGGLPLALEQAAAYMQATGTTLVGFLSLFRHRRAQLLARGEPAGYSKTVASTWTLAFDRLRQTGTGAVGLLRLLAFCAPESVPLRLLLQPRPGLAGRLGGEVVPMLAPLLEDPLAASDAIGALRRYSLVTPAADGSVSLHRLVQAVTVDQMQAELAKQWRQAASALIEAAIPADTSQPQIWQVCAALLPHAQAALADDSDGMARIANYLGSSGNYAAARDLQRRVLDAQERVLGPERPDTLAARQELARWTGRAGDPAAARDQYAELLPVRERVLGPEHPETLITRASVAGWTGEAGDPAAARDQFAELLPVRERVSGPEHPETLTARASLARWTGQAGTRPPPGTSSPSCCRCASGSSVRSTRRPCSIGTSSPAGPGTRGTRPPPGQLAELLPVRERVSGPEHPDTLAARQELARWTGRAGDLAAARDQYAELLPVRERVLGPEHPETLITRASLARWTGQAGDPAAAWDQLAELLPVRERVLGPEHPETLFNRHELARWTGHAGDPAAARDQLAELLPVRERVSGPEHPDTLAARQELARWTGRAGDLAAARDQFAELLPVRERVLGPERPETLITRASLARWTGQAGDPAAARDQFAELLPVRERVLGPEHPETLTARASLARWTGQAGDLAAARDQFAELLPVRERVSRPEHPDTVITGRNSPVGRGGRPVARAGPPGGRGAEGSRRTARGEAAGDVPDCHAVLGDFVRVLISIRFPWRRRQSDRSAS